MYIVYIYIPSKLIIVFLYDVSVEKYFGVNEHIRKRIRIHKQIYLRMVIVFFSRANSSQDADWMFCILTALPMLKLI